MGQRVSDTTTVDADIQAVFDVIIDLETYPDWAEGVLETEILSRDGADLPAQARFRVDARVSEVTYTLEYAYDGHDISWTLVEGEMLNQLDGAYTLTEKGPDRTEVRYSLEADVDMPIPGFLKKRAAKTILEQGLSGLKDRAEGHGSA